METIKAQWSRFRSPPARTQIIAGFILFLAVCLIGGMIQGA